MQKTMRSCVRPGELGRLLGVCTQTIGRWVEQGKLPPPIGISSHRRWRREVIERFAAEHGIDIPEEMGVGR